MLTGAFAAAVGAWATGSPLLGLLICIVAVFPVALLQAVLSNTLRANQIVTGIGINILVLGATTLAYREIFGARSREQNSRFTEMEPAAARRYSDLRRSRIPAGMAALCRAGLNRGDSFGVALHLGRYRRARRWRGAARCRQVRCFSLVGPISRRHIRRFYVGSGRRVSFDRRHSHVHRGDDARSRLSRDCRRYLRKVDGRRHRLGVSVVRCGDSLAVSITDIGHRCAKCVADHAALLVGAAGGRRIGRPTDGAASAWRTLPSPIVTTEGRHPVASPPFEAGHPEIGARRQRLLTRAAARP